MRHQPEPSSLGGLRVSWLVIGMLLIMFGTFQFVAKELAPEAIGMLVLGVSVLVLSVVKAGGGTSTQQW